MLKRLISSLLAFLAKHYIKKSKPIIIGVVGSVGKTSVKTLVSGLLSTKYTVIYSKKGYNADFGIFLTVLDEEHPKNLKDGFGWMKILFSAIKKVLFAKKVDYMVLEMGIDHPGEMKTILQFVQPNQVVLTAISPEHMEYFKDLDTVAKEELLPLEQAQMSFLNHDMVDSNYSKQIITKCKGVRLSTKAAKHELTWEVVSKNSTSTSIHFQYNGKKYEITVLTISTAMIQSLMLSIVVALENEIGIKRIQSFIPSLQPVSGRMNVFSGLNGSTIVDDSYNSSPAALTQSILDIKSLKSSKKILILGAMNEMGDYAQEAYKTVNKVIDQKITHLVLVGTEAGKFIKSTSNKTTVKKVTNALIAANYVLKLLEKNDLVLVKGSQGGLFLEETVKLLLANPSDSQKLCRQDEFWMSRKRKFFNTQL
jgi:UDP-N-acetylmuramoyl-tripeptide--D-alanyl-D-alanine ligase